MPQEKTSVIPNILDQNKFFPDKKMTDARYTLGMIGITPKMKRLDLALDTLEILLNQDSRYKLRIKGYHPFEYNWIIRQEDEIAYYQEIMRRINSSDRARYKVIFDPPGNDVNTWLRLVGFILSPSDFEAFHLAVGEGMLTGCVPVVWNWEGADEIWPSDSIVFSSKQAAEKINSYIYQEWEKSGNQSREYVVIQYNLEQIVAKWIKILEE